MVEDPKFNNTILTNIGHQMLASIASGNRKLTYTKAEAYTQDVSSIANETLQALTSLQGKELSANLLVSNDNGNVVTITANFENKGLTNDVVFNSIGWFAKLDTDDAEHGITANQEYLIGITPANGAQTLVAPPADQSASQAISLNLNMTLSDAANVNMTVSDAGAVHFNQLDDQLAKYTTTSDLTKLLAGKADLGLSYTKAELDAKLLNLTTDTNGKVSADQVQALISDKANISDVYTKSQIDSALSTRDSQINTKANISDVYTKSQVDSALSTRDTEISTKANISDVYTKSDVDSALAVDRGRLGKLEGTQTLDSPDFNSITSTGVYYITNNTPANIKNNPVSQCGVLVVSNGDGNRTSQVYYPDDGSPQWCRLLNGSNWLPWYQLGTKKDISNAINKFDLSKVKFRKQYLNGDGQATDKTWSATKNEDGTYTIDLCNDDWTAAKLADVLAQLPNKANASDVYTKAEVDSKTSGTVITAYDIASKTPTKVTDSYRNKWLVDQNALSQFADQINQLKGRRTVDAPDFNTLTDSGVYLISSPDKGKNFPIGSWGVLVVFNGDSQRTEQIYFTDDGANVFMRTYGWINGTTNWCNWNQIAWKSDISNLQNTVNEALKSLIPDDTHAPALPAGFDLNNYFVGWRRSVNTTLKNMPFGWLSDTMYFQGTVAGSDGRFEIALYIGNGPNGNPKIAYRFYGWDHWKPWVLFADNDDISNLQNQIQQLRESQFEVQTFTDATAAANWEAQKPGKRMAIVNS